MNKIVSSSYYKQAVGIIFSVNLEADKTVLLEMREWGQRKEWWLKIVLCILCPMIAQECREETTSWLVAKVTVNMD